MNSDHNWMCTTSINFGGAMPLLFGTFQVFPQTYQVRTVFFLENSGPLLDVFTQFQLQILSNFRTTWLINFVPEFLYLAFDFLTQLIYFNFLCNNTKEIQINYFSDFKTQIFHQIPYHVDSRIIYFMSFAYLHVLSKLDYLQQSLSSRKFSYLLQAILMLFRSQSKQANISIPFCKVAIISQELISKFFLLWEHLQQESLQIYDKCQLTQIVDLHFFFVKFYVIFQDLLTQTLFNLLAPLLLFVLLISLYLLIGHLGQVFIFTMANE